MLGRRETHTSKEQGEKIISEEVVHKQSENFTRKWWLEGVCIEEDESFTELAKFSVKDASQTYVCILPLGRK